MDAAPELAAGLCPSLSKLDRPLPTCLGRLRLRGSHIVDAYAFGKVREPSQYTVSPLHTHPQQVLLDHLA